MPSRDPCAMTYLAGYHWLPPAALTALHCTLPVTAAVHATLSRPNVSTIVYVRLWFPSNRKHLEGRTRIGINQLIVPELIFNIDNVISSTSLKDVCQMAASEGREI